MWAAALFAMTVEYIGTPLLLGAPQFEAVRVGEVRAGGRVIREARRQGAPHVVNIYTEPLSCVVSNEHLLKSLFNNQ